MGEEAVDEGPVGADEPVSDWEPTAYLTHSRQWFDTLELSSKAYLLPPQIDELFYIPFKGAPPDALMISLCFVEDSQLLPPSAARAAA